MLAVLYVLRYLHKKQHVDPSSMAMYRRLINRNTNGLLGKAERHNPIFFAVLKILILRVGCLKFWSRRKAPNLNRNYFDSHD